MQQVIPLSSFVGKFLEVSFSVIFGVLELLFVKKKKAPDPVSAAHEKIYLIGAF